MSTIKTLVARAKELPAEKGRFVAAMVGACVADAATRPLHWIYNQDTLDQILNSVENPEFFPENKCPFYDLPTGKNSCNNEMVKCMLYYLDKNKSAWDVQGVCEEFKMYFGEGTEFDASLKKRKEPGFKGPVKGSYIQAGIVKMLENLQAGNPLQNSGNNQYDGFLSALPLIGKYAGTPSILEEMRKVILLLTTNEETIDYFNADIILLEQCLLGSEDPFVSMKERIKVLSPTVFKKIEALEWEKGESFIATTAKHGKACSLPGAFLSSYLALLQSSTFTDAVRLNISGGGDNCSRANMIGAYHGARYGIEAIPLDWMEKVTNIEKVFESAINVAMQ